MFSIMPLGGHIRQVLDPGFLKGGVCVLGGGGGLLHDIYKLTEFGVSLTFKIDPKYTLFII